MARTSPRFFVLLQRLLEGSPPVLTVLAHNPFHGRPPRYVRAALHLYRFSSPDGRRTRGVWWRGSGGTFDHGSARGREILVTGLGEGVFDVRVGRRTPNGSAETHLEIRSGGVRESVLDCGLDRVRCRSGTSADWRR